MTDPAPLLLVLGPLAGALLAAAVLWSDRPPSTVAIRLVAPTVDVAPPPPLPDWAAWQAPDLTVPTVVLPWRRNPLASTWPDPPPATHMRQTTALTSSVARAWDMQGYDW